MLYNNKIGVVAAATAEVAKDNQEAMREVLDKVEQAVRAEQVVKVAIVKAGGVAHLEETTVEMEAPRELMVATGHLVSDELRTLKIELPFQTAKFSSMFNQFN